MKTIFVTEFGSTVYGTRVPTSDTDYKAIFIPDAKDILLQRAPKTIVEGTKVDKNSKNSAEDIDTEKFAMHQYLDLLMQGQTVALDMLFTPKQFWKSHSREWERILMFKDCFLHKGTTSFIGYAKTQAAKYGIKGTRVAAMRHILDILKACPKHHVKLKELEFLVNGELPQNEHIKIVMCKGPNGQDEPHLEVCNRKIAFHATVKYAIDIFQRIFDEYGARALAAEQNNGVDWKALMHAVRVCNQAKELLQYGTITFPRPDAALLLQIRKSELPYKQVAGLIENGLEELETIKEKSTLNDKPKREVAEMLVVDAYSEAILDKYGD